MLSKLLRHEFRATGRIMLPVYALLLVSCGGCTLFGRLLGRYPESTVLSVVQTVFATLFGVTTFGMLLLTLVLMVYRFYKNLMTDEGYLMFTLPVSRSQLIWSKLLVALVWSVLSTVLAALAFLCIRILHNALHALDDLGKFICVGVFAMMAIQIIINIGMCLGVLPVIGVTLPFLSAGGTSTGTLYLGIGVVLSVYMHSGKDMLFA